MDDPILLTLTAISLFAIPLGSHFLGKIRITFVFLLPLIAMTISFPVFLLLVIVRDAGFSIYLFYVSMSLWTGGFIGIFISWILFAKHKKKLK